MVDERPGRRGRKRGRGRPKKALAKRPRAKQPPVPKEEQLPGLLEGKIPEQPPVTEEAAVEEEQPAVAEQAVEEELPAVAEQQTISAEAVAVEEAVPAPELEPAREPARPAALPGTLMNIPEFRQRVVRLVVRKLS